MGERRRKGRVIGLVLIVDDEPEIRTELAGYLNDKGYAVDVAGDGLEALERFKAVPADVVITDLKMARYPGEALIGRLREMDPDVPIIAVTGHYSPNDMGAAKEAGATAVIKKPIRLRDLHRMLRDLLGAEDD